MNKPSPAALWVIGCVDCLAGLVFGVGLVLAGMTDPRKVLGFLDITGAWDPSLAFVLGGAVGFSVFAFQAALRRRRPWLVDAFRLPARTKIDRTLLIGAGLFGIGWGLAGYCPGPAIVSLAWSNREAWVFVPAMLAGAAIAWRHIRARNAKCEEPSTSALTTSGR